MAASAIQRVDSIDVAGPQNLNSGNWPNTVCNSSRNSSGSVQMSAIFRPSARYIGRGVTVKSQLEYIAYHQQMLAQVKSLSRARAMSQMRGACTSLSDCFQNLI